MAKGSGKNTRAARQAARQGIDLDIDDIKPLHKSDGKTRVLEQLAEKGVRETSKESQGQNSGGIVKSPKQKMKKKPKTKSELKKQQRALAFKDILEEKVQQSVRRHKTIKSYRKAEETD